MIREESKLASKIIDLFREENAEPKDAMGAAMIVVRFLIEDTKDSADAIKAAFCKFIDDTSGLYNGD